MRCDVERGILWKLGPVRWCRCILASALWGIPSTIAAECVLDGSPLLASTISPAASSSCRGWTCCPHCQSLPDCGGGLRKEGLAGATTFASLRVGR